MPSDFLRTIASRKLIRVLAGSELAAKGYRAFAGWRGAGQSCAFIALDAFQAVSVNWPDQLIPTSSSDAISARYVLVFVRPLHTSTFNLVFQHAHLHTHTLSPLVSCLFDSLFFTVPLLLLLLLLLLCSR